MSGLGEYADRVLSGTGVGAGDVPALVAGDDSSAVAQALRAGWCCAEDATKPAVTE